MLIHLNDKPRVIEEGKTLGSLMEELGLADGKGVAVAINGEVIPRAAWPIHVPNDADRVLIIRATQGG